MIKLLQMQGWKEDRRRFEMNINHPAVIKYVEDDMSFLVEFPDLHGCLTEGTTLEEAKDNAKEALTGYLESIFERNLPLTKPSQLAGQDIYYIEPEPEVSVSSI
ncbi:MAG: type II toxin-antitoxin system HicB family antitoxin [Nitrospirae bacterium]|nr:type II toxin-antitoxin system HicB family antitoxin [Nitrospirota bacterium]